jgi:pantetheine-phosphate adenylyltransferase
MSRVLYPGSFDPPHLGHLDVIAQAAELFGDVVVGVLQNLEKPSALFTGAERVRLVEDSVAAVPELAGKVEVMVFTGLAIGAAADLGADFIVKGLRTAGDFEIEQQMAQTNYSVSGIRTVYLPCDPALGYVSSRFVREIARYGRDVGHMVPAPVAAALMRVNSPGTE